MEVYPIPNQEATTVATKLIDELFCRFSIPDCLHSDQGQQFESEIIAHVCKLLNIEKSRTTPYHPQSDGLIEQFNRTLIQMLSTCTDQHPFDWEEHFPKLCMAYNSSKQVTTGYSPFFLMFGREARLPVDIMYGSDQPGTDHPQYVQKLRSTLTEASTGCVNKPDSSRNDNRSSTIEGYMGNPTNLECWSGCSPLLFLEVDTESSTAPIGSWPSSQIVHIGSKMSGITK